MLTRKQLSSRWNCSLDTIDRRVKTGQLPAVRLGRLVRFKEEDVERYENDHSYELKVIDKRRPRTVVRVIV